MTTAKTRKPAKKAISYFSKNRKHARQKLAKDYLKAQRQREDAARKQRNTLVTLHNLMTIEDLKKEESSKKNPQRRILKEESSKKNPQRRILKEESSTMYGGVCQFKCQGG